MAQLNRNYDKLAAGYLFPEIARRTQAFLEANPGAQIMKLGIGNTTEPITPSIAEAMVEKVRALATREGYSGYGAEQGNVALREALAADYARRGIGLDASEIFVSDGAKSDTANLQSLFGLDMVVALPDPVYPVYLDTNVIAGRTGQFCGSRYEGVVYMPCAEENDFAPRVQGVGANGEGALETRLADSAGRHNPQSYLIYLCSPGNPTGAVMTHVELKEFVDFARKTDSVIIFDAAYAAFIQQPELPRSIFEVEGAKDCAIEVNSFSKNAGFTGVRCGWTVVPKQLKSGGVGEVHKMWNRRQCTFFNGASSISQAGALAALDEEGRRECQRLVDYYMGNAQIIKDGVENLGFKAFGGVNAPYIWMKTNGVPSWDFFDKLLGETHVVGTPGAGFGPSGEGFFRLSAFGHREDVEQAVESITRNLRV